MLSPSHLPPLPLEVGVVGARTLPPAPRRASEPLILPLTRRRLPVYTRSTSPQNEAMACRWTGAGSKLGTLAPQEAQT